MSESITPQELAEEVVRLYYGVEPSHKIMRAHLTGIIIRVIAPRIAELEAERDRLKIEKQALWGKLLLIERRRPMPTDSAAR